MEGALLWGEQGQLRMCSAAVGGLLGTVWPPGSGLGAAVWPPGSGLGAAGVWAEGQEDHITGGTQSHSKRQNSESISFIIFTSGGKKAFIPQH